MKMIRSLLIAGAAVAAIPALAQQSFSPWYLGAGVGQGHLGISGTDLTGFDNASVGKTETTYTIRGGVRFNPFLGVELGYYDLGKYDFHGNSFSGVSNVDGQAKAQSYGISLVGTIPLDQFDLYGRIGYAHSQVKLNASGQLNPTPFNSKDTHDEATYGVGGRWNFNPAWGLFAEWMKNDKIKVDSYLIGVDYKFAGM
ncbi:MAG TPA: porin family protein [Usitatibacter sp.]|nr:porin family protein [Usitatibacter sp.]